MLSQYQHHQKVLENSMTYVNMTSHEAIRVHPKATIEMNRKFLWEHH